MNRYVVERILPGAGQLSKDELAALAQRSVDALVAGSRMQWVRSYVTADKLFCVYLADDEAAIRDHGRRGGFPVDAVHLVRTIIDPTTADA